MDALDQQIITWLQNDFPLEERPYQALADRLGIGESEVWTRIQRLRDEGVIRRLGASLDSRRLGFSSTLAAVRVPGARVDEAAEVIGGYPEVTHSYLRDDVFNIWFTVIAQDEQAVERVLVEVRQRLGLAESDVLNVPMKRLFKLDARFFPRAASDVTGSSESD